MNVQQQVGPDFRARASFAGGTSFLAGITGLAVATLAVIGLAKVNPASLVEVAAIVLGAALMFEAGVDAARYSAVRKSMDVHLGYAWFAMVTNIVAAIGGITLGIIALAGVRPDILMPVAAIAFGSALAVDSCIIARLSRREPVQTTRFWIAAGIVQFMIGIGSITLGIVSLAYGYSLILSLVAMLANGTALLFSGSIVGRRMRKITHMAESY